MPRNNNLTITELSARSIRMIDLVRIDIPNGDTLRFTDAETDLTSTIIDGSTVETFLTGQGYLGHQPIDFTSQLSATTMELTFDSSQVDSASDFIARKMLNNAIGGGDIYLIKRLISDNLTGTDFILFKGSMDNVSYKVSNSTSNIKLFCSGPFANFDRQAIYGYTNVSSQSKLYPTDTGFQYSTKNFRNIRWEE